VVTITIWHVRFVEHAADGDVVMTTPDMRKYWLWFYPAEIKKIEDFIATGAYPGPNDPASLTAAEAYLTALKAECWTPKRNILVKRQVR
jgi:hypothetical protein